MTNNTMDDVPQDPDHDDEPEAEGPFFLLSEDGVDTFYLPPGAYGLREGFYEDGGQ